MIICALAPRESPRGIPGGDRIDGGVHSAILPATDRMAAGADHGEVRQVAAAADDQDHRPPPLRVRDVDACCVARWAEQFRDHTLPFAIRKLTDDEVAYLHSDGVFLPAGGGAPPGTYVVEEGGSDTEALDSDSDDDGGGRAGAAAPANRPEVSLPELVAWMEHIIDDFGGDVLPKLNWSTPKVGD